MGLKLGIQGYMTPNFGAIWARWKSFRMTQNRYCTQILSKFFGKSWSLEYPNFFPRPPRTPSRTTEPWLCVSWKCTCSIRSLILKSQQNRIELVSRCAATGRDWRQIDCSPSTAHPQLLRRLRRSCPEVSGLGGNMVIQTTDAEIDVCCWLVPSPEAIPVTGRDAWLPRS